MNVIGIIPSRMKSSRLIGKSMKKIQNIENSWQIKTWNPQLQIRQRGSKSDPKDYRSSIEYYVGNYRPFSTVLRWESRVSRSRRS